jgi:exopolyphosphatase / guanosine-5'-triphosphate,3'-diphosphate pyrophosphatase
MQKIAAIDVGANSFHLIVARVAGGVAFEVIDSAKELVRLGERALLEGEIPAEAIERAAAALSRLRQVAERHGCNELLAYATSAAREARNREAFLQAMREQAGVFVRLISGEEEARLIFLGACQELDLRRGDACIADLGGGSLELIRTEAGRVREIASLKLGFLRLLPFLPSDPPTPSERAQLSAHIHSELGEVTARWRGDIQLALTGGTARALAKLAQLRAPSRSEPRRLSSSSLYALEGELASLSKAQRAALPKLPSARADTILPGALVLRALYEALGLEEATVIRAAFREGLLVDYLSRLATERSPLSCLYKLGNLDPGGQHPRSI